MHLVGSFTPPRGAGRGIHLLSGEPGSREVGVLATVDSPSFVAAHPSLPLLYAVAERRGELVVVDAVSGDILQDAVPAGEAACHVRVAPDGSSVVVACWGNGAVLRYPLDAEGRVVGREIAPAAVVATSDPDAVSRAHASAAFGDGFVTTDLGLDLVRVWSDDETLAEVQRVDLPAGSGPRHLVVRGDTLHVVTEYSVEIVTLTRGDDGMLAITGIAPVRVDGAREGDTGAEIALDPTGRWLTVGVRGSDLIAVSRITADGTVPVSEAPCGGAIPRHHVHDGDAVLVANQGSSTVTRLPFDAVYGTVGAVVETIEVGTPTFLLRRN